MPLRATSCLKLGTWFTLQTRGGGAWRRKANEWVFKTRGSLTCKRGQYATAWMQFQACHCPWRFPCASMLFSSSSSPCRPWQAIVHGRHLQSQPPVFTMEIYSLRETHVEYSTALLIKKTNALFWEGQKQFLCWLFAHRLGPFPCFLCCLGGLCGVFIQSCLLYYIIYTCRLFQALVVIMAEI